MNCPLRILKVKVLSPECAEEFESGKAEKDLANDGEDGGIDASNCHNNTCSFFRPQKSRLEDICFPRLCKRINDSSRFRIVASDTNLGQAPDRNSQHKSIAPIARTLPNSD